MRMAQRRMAVRMHMRFLAVPGEIMSMLVMRIVDIRHMRACGVAQQYLPTFLSHFIDSGLVQRKLLLPRMMIVGCRLACPCKVPINAGELKNIG